MKDASSTMSLDIQKNTLLSSYTTLKVGGAAEYFVSVSEDAELVEAVTFAKKHMLPITVLGGGSNVLVSEHGVRGLVIHIALKGYRSRIEGDTVFLAVAAGEDFDSVIAHTVGQGWWGLENLSHIPGTVGATPVQNVGAYGVEAKDVVHSVRVFNIENEELQVLDGAACSFAYRDSLFKHHEGSKYIITEVIYALSLSPRRHLSYRDLATWFEDVPEPSQQEIREAVMKIRAGKFPDWNTVGTAGSFFKNPIISSDVAALLQQRYPELPVFTVNDQQSKVSLGWILDKVLKLKGYASGNVALYKEQALVLVADESATADEIENFANSITEKIKTETGIAVEWEVRKLK